MALKFRKIQPSDTQPEQMQPQQNYNVADTLGLPPPLPPLPQKEEAQNLEVQADELKVLCDYHMGKFLEYYSKLG